MPDFLRLDQLGLAPGEIAFCLGVALAAVSFPLLLVSQWYGRRAFIGASESRYRRVALWFLALLAALTAARAGWALLARL